MISHTIETKTIRQNPELSEKQELYRILYGLFLTADPEEWLMETEVDRQGGQSPGQSFLRLSSTLDAS
jgi:hypothetical protein